MLLLPQPLTQLPLLLPTQPQHLLLMLQLHLLLTQLLLLQLKKRSSNLPFSDKRLFIQPFVTHKKASFQLAFFRLHGVVASAQFFLKQLHNVLCGCRTVGHALRIQHRHNCARV